MGAIETSTHNEGLNVSDIVKWEEDHFRSRETVTVLAGDGAARELTLGTVLGKITASEKVVAIDFAGADGSEEAYAILLRDVTAPDGVDAEGLVLFRNADIVVSNLIWPAGATQPQKDAALAELKAKDIFVREEV